MTEPTTPRRAVLVVDDDPLLRSLISMALEDEGFDVAEAGDGGAALELVASRRFDLMLLDGQMPVLSGRQVLARLRADPRTALLPVILVTAADALVDRLSGLAAGADDYLTKPVSLDEVVARVRAHLRAREAWAETLAAHDRQRSHLALALQAAGRQVTLTGSATVLCHALAAQVGVRAAVVVRFGADGEAVTVATAGPALWGCSAGDPVAGPVRDHLRRRASGGPWLEQGDGRSRPGLLAGALVACAPFSGDASERFDPAGLLLLELDKHSRVEPASALAATIDFAAAVHGLLQPRLRDEHNNERERLALRTVLRDRAFRPHFQPIVDMETGAVVGAEALTRFTDGSPPDTRFREAAGLGLGLELEWATLAAAIEEVGPFLPADAWLALNVSPALLLSSDRLLLADLLGLSSRDVVLELSEYEAIDDYDAVRAAIDELGGKVRLSIDDAGSGFASLRHILRLEPEFIKLDRSWIHDVDSDPALRAMIAGLRHFADQTGAAVIAEGIEREEERLVLIDLGVDLGQGYLLGRPAAASAA